MLISSRSRLFCLKVSVFANRMVRKYIKRIVVKCISNQVLHFFVYQYHSYYPHEICFYPLRVKFLKHHKWDVTKSVFFSTIQCKFSSPPHKRIKVKHNPFVMIIFCDLYIFRRYIYIYIYISNWKTYKSKQMMTLLHN